MRFNTWIFIALVISLLVPFHTIHGQDNNILVVGYTGNNSFLCDNKSSVNVEDVSLLATFLDKDAHPIGTSIIKVGYISAGHSTRFETTVPKGTESFRWLLQRAKYYGSHGLVECTKSFAVVADSSVEEEN